jgi:hypothetical protein
MRRTAVPDEALMNILLESPWPAIMFGIFGEALLAVILLRTGRGVLLWAMAGVLLISLLGVALVKYVVTERKLVAAALYDTAAAIEANDLDRVLQHVAPEDEYTRHQAEDALRQVQVISMKISYLEITVNRLTTPPTAKAVFNFVATGKYRSGESFVQTYPGKIAVEMRREPNGWVITEHRLIRDPR